MVGFFNQRRDEDPGSEVVNTQGVPTAAERWLAEAGYQSAQSGYRSSFVSTTTLMLGGQATNQGRDSRSGIVVTIQAVGTAIRRQQRVEMPAPQAVMRVGMAA